MQKKEKTLLGKEFAKVQPKLRVITNGDEKVNAIRAEQCGAVVVGQKQILSDVPPMVTDDASPVLSKELPRSAKRGSINSLAPGIKTNVFIQTDDSFVSKDQMPAKVTAQRMNLMTAEVTFDEVKNLASQPEVLYVEAGSNLKEPTPEISPDKVDEPNKNRWLFTPSQKHGRGKLDSKHVHVLVGIVDVNGFDFSHPDFLDENGNTRFVRIWDQGGDTRPSPIENGGQYDYGSEITDVHMNLAIDTANNQGVFGLPAYELEPQANMASSSHGTHVASIAAGNNGVCSKAMIAAVNLSLPKEDSERRQSFYDSTRIVHAVDYLIDLADELSEELSEKAGKKVTVPVVINVSLGTNGHAHDGSSPLSRWIDSSLSVPGRALCVAAGNAGQEVAEFEGDIGFVMGRIHTSGKVAARGLNNDIEWLVVGNGIADLSENELEIWYSSQDRFGISVRPPEMDWIGPVEPRQFIENQQLPDKSFLSIYNEMYHPANGSNHISVYLSPFFGDSGIVGVPAGKWTVRLHGMEVREGSYHGWIERDDPRKLGRIGEKDAWRFPSFFSEKSNVDNSSVSTLACGFRILSVANLDAAKEMVNITSSQGPTRDKRPKPDVAAPGTDIVAANGFATDDKRWVKMTGTSMASPYVAGIVGLMLAIEPKLTAAQIEGIVQCSSQPLPGEDFTWRDTAGFGQIDPEKCLEEANKIKERMDLTET